MFYCYSCNISKPLEEFGIGRNDCKPCTRKKLRPYKAKHHKENLTKTRMQKRTKLYGISEQKWNELFKKQGRCCGICKSPTPNGEHDWATDHNPNTGEVRGILCVHCNLIVRRHATPEILRAAASYLEGVPCNGFGRPCG